MTEEIAAEASLRHVRDAHEFSKRNSKINLDGQTDGRTHKNNQAVNILQMKPGKIRRLTSLIMKAGGRRQEARGEAYELTL